MSDPAIEPTIEPAADPAADPAAPPAPAWSMTEEQYNELANAVGQLARLEQQRAAVYQPDQPRDDAADWDPFDPNSVRQLIRSEMAPFQETQQTVAEAQWQETIDDVMTDEASRNGDFDHELAELYALRILPEELQRAGGNQIQALERTVERAAALVRERDRRRDEQAVARYTNQVSTLAGAPAEPGSSYSQGIEQRVVPDYRKPGSGSVTDRFFADVV